MSWGDPVVFWDRDTSTIQTVSSAFEAIHYLDRWWKKEDGDPFYTAIVTCMNAARGEAPQSDARKRFITALVAGGVKLSGGSKA